MTTRGDQILDRALNKVGGKGLFIKELEEALLSGTCDLAVHSLKDVPMSLLPEFELAAMLSRADPRDAFVSSDFDDLESLPPNATVGTSSLRREAQLRALRPDLEIEPLRGNLDTRLAKLDRGDFQAIILAAAGLQRLGLGARIRGLLTPEVCLPAPGQGVLGIEILSSRHDLTAWLAPLNDAETAAAARAEREVSRVLGGSCEVPLAAFAEFHGNELRCRALVASADGSEILRAHGVGQLDAPERLGSLVAEGLMRQGAQRLIPG
jgi:hydroxymethylbilane synthase